MKRGKAPENPMDDFVAMRRDMAASAIEISDLALDAAVVKLDALFGAGFAKANPALVGQYLETTTRTFQNDMATMADMGEDFGLDLDLPPHDLDRRR
jgi:hypothetical protein